jgi:multidrug efflux pump subunit AcrA (membrane-fusion protein)
MHDTPSEPRRFSIRLSRRLWLGVVAIGLSVTAVGLCICLPIYRPQVANSEIERLGSSVETRELSAESPTRGISEEAAEPQADRVPEIRNARPEDESGAIDDPADAVRLVAFAQPGPPVPLVVSGRTRCLLSGRGIIASAILRPVVEVLVCPGDRVTKGQALIKLYDLEPQANVRAREKELRSIEAKAKFSRLNVDMAENTPNTGALPYITLNELRAAALSNEAQVLAAEAELSLAQSELKLYTVTAAIDGEIAWLDVSPGTVTWPGSMIWGEIVDLRELDVRCELSPVQAEQVAVGQSAEAWLDGKEPAAATGNVVFVGKFADRNSGLVPVIVRVANEQQQLRAEVAVKVRFRTEKGR